MDDRHTNVEALKARVARFVLARDWDKYHSPKNLAMSISIEAAEIMEHFQWLTIEEAHEAMREEAIRAEVADELADVLIYCLSFAHQTGIDLSAAIEQKLERNEERFPVERIKGYGVERDEAEEGEQDQPG